MEEATPGNVVKAEICFIPELKAQRSVSSRLKDIWTHISLALGKFVANSRRIVVAALNGVRGVQADVGRCLDGLILQAREDCGPESEIAYRNWRKGVVLSDPLDSLAKAIDFVIEECSCQRVEAGDHCKLGNRRCSLVCLLLS